MCEPRNVHSQLYNPQPYSATTAPATAPTAITAQDARPSSRPAGAPLKGVFEGEAAPVDAPEDAGGALLEAEDPAEVALAEPDPEEVIDREDTVELPDTVEEDDDTLDGVAAMLKSPVEP